MEKTIEICKTMRAGLLNQRKGWRWEKRQARKLLSTNKHAFIAKNRMKEAEKHILEIDKRVAEIENFEKTKKGGEKE